MPMVLDPKLLAATLDAKTTRAVNDLLGDLPINPDYVYDEDNPRRGWLANKLHWVPVGLELGNAGRIKLGNEPDNRIAERVVNMLEALIELARRLELKRDPHAPAPSSPREAVQRYFGLPRLDQIPKLEGTGRSGPLYKAMQVCARQVRVIVSGTKAERAIVFEDEGIGQPPSRLHETILSLGGSNKDKEGYMIGMWGQGGSSALAASKLTWIVSRRAPQLGDAEDDVAWTVVREVPPLRPARRPYYAYLAGSPTGEVPRFAGSAAARVNFTHGTRIGHIGFDLGSLDVTRLYQAMNHVLPNPVLPFDICTKKAGDFDTCRGVGYALSRAREMKKTDLEKLFEGLPVIQKEQR